MQVLDRDAFKANQHRTRVSWSHKSDYGIRARVHLRRMLDNVGRKQKIVDLGGNDGYAADSVKHLCDITVVDIIKEKVDYASSVYGLKSLESFIEELPFQDNEFDWGFCSHTLEHVHNLDVAWSQIKRICKYGCWVVVPIETEEEFESTANPSHLRFNDHDGWIQWLSSRSFEVIAKTKGELVCLFRF